VPLLTYIRALLFTLFDFAMTYRCRQSGMNVASLSDHGCALTDAAPWLWPAKKRDEHRSSDDAGRTEDRWKGLMIGTE
jgi:hypothetical protein